MRKTLVLLHNAILSLLITLAMANVLSANDLPNIVVYISDDLGRLDTSIHGSVDVKTPTMERLAASGMTFEHAYVASPSCCPNRNSLLTGLMPARHGAHPNHSQVKSGTRFLLPILKSLGYRIISFGKVAHGRAKMEGCDFNSPQPRNLFNHVQDYFSKHKIDEPICLLVGDRRPHVSWTERQDYEPGKVTLPSYFIDTLATREHWSRYLTDITGMDREMGQVDDLVRERLGKNCIFLFTSDHGGQWPRGKWNLYDAGIRVPLVVSWPGVIPAGRRTDAMVSWVDILPTLIDLVGGEVPSDIDGKSFASVLRNGETGHRDRIFTTHTGDGAMNIFPMRSVRNRKFKYIVNLTPDAWHTNHSDRHRKDGAGAFWDSWDEAATTDPRAAAIVKAYYTRPKEELFDVEADPLELTNLAADPAQRKRLDSLRSELARWTDTQADDMRPHREPYLRSKPLPELKPK